jgi:iron(III) transport system substrate-binding protein
MTLLVLLIIAAGAAAYGFTMGAGPAETVTRTVTQATTVTKTTTTEEPDAWDMTVAAAKQEGKVSIMFVHSAMQKVGVFERFTEIYGIEVEQFKMGTQDIIPRVTAEATAGKLSTDIVFGPPARSISPLAANGFIAQYPDTPSTREWPPELVDPAGFWVGWAPGPYGISYNKNFLTDEELKKLDIDALAFDSDFKGRIGVTNWAVGGIERSVIAALYGWYGDEKLEQWLTALHSQQDVLLHDDDAALRTLMGKGEIHIFFPNSLSTNLLQIQEGAPYGWIDDKPNSIVGYFISGGMTKNAPHPNAAIVLFDFLSSDEGQELMGKSIVMGKPGITYPAQVLTKNIQNYLFLEEANFVKYDPAAQAIWTKVRQSLGI